jgi:hypothetical protein
LGKNKNYVYFSNIIFITFFCFFFFISFLFFYEIFFFRLNDSLEDSLQIEKFEPNFTLGWILEKGVFEKRSDIVTVSEEGYNHCVNLYYFNLM